MAKNRIDKVNEEIQELHSAYKSGDEQNTHEELGDVLFSVINLSRFLKVNPELALGDSTEKFVRRFKKVEELAVLRGKSSDEMTFEEMDALWDEVKKAENA